MTQHWSEGSEPGRRGDSQQLGLLRPARMPRADGHTLPWASQEAASTWERSKAVKKELFKPQA